MIGGGAESSLFCLEFHSYVKNWKEFRYFFSLSDTKNCANCPQRIPETREITAFSRFLNQSKYEHGYLSRSLLAIKSFC